MYQDIFTYFVKKAYTKKPYPDHEMIVTDGWIGEVHDIITWEGELYEIIDYTWEFTPLETGDAY